MRKQFGDQFADIGMGAQRAEEFFGYEAGHRLSQILLANSVNYNAYFHQSNPRAIVIQDEVLKSGGSVAAVAFHEVVHLVDNYLDGKLSAGKFQEWFRELRQSSPRFLDQICEKNFLPNVQAGHAKDDSAEFLASFVNSLTHPRWAAAMRERSTEFCENYRKSCEVLREVLNEAGISSGSPIVQSLRAKEKFIEIQISP